MSVQIRLAALVWALAALAAVAHAARVPAAIAARTGRALQQDSSVCNRTIVGCTTCRFVSFGSRSRTLCTACEAGYQVRNSGRACWCAPGLYWDQANSTWQCVPCGAGFYCPGARVTQASGAVRLPCGAYKTTTTDYARSDRECVVLPGHGWGPGDESEPCPIGTYNSGYNTRRCTVCAGGLTTEQERSESVDQCVAPEGSFYLRGRAIACWRGSYKETTGTDGCEPCPEGFTTAEGQVGMTSPDNCTWVLPGYYAEPGAVLGTTEATKCPEDTYRGGDALYDNATGVACTPCPPFMATVTVGATSPSACLAPPGNGYNSSAAAAYVCPLGTYNEGWNRRPCIDCGAGNVTTDAPGSTSPDDCVTPPGHTLYEDTDGVFIAELCETDFFGSPNKTYGLQYVPCLACPEHTTNYGPGGTDPAQCVTLPGYGFEDGGVAICEYGYWAAGDSRLPCAYCGDGYNTTAGGAAGGAPVQGATSAADCVVAQGHELQAAGGVAACRLGFYKDSLGPAACTRCPGATTTTKISGATHLSDCDACERGFGVDPNTGVIDPAAPECLPCGGGWWGPGGRGAGRGAACERCPKPDGFTGNMQSRVVTTTPEGCLPEFTTDAARNTSHLTWDFIPMDAAALSPVPAATSLSACQAACAASADCQYFQYDTAGVGVAGGPAAKCLLRDTVAYSNVNVSDTSKSYVFFEIADGHYVAWNAHASDAASLGRALGAHATLAAALDACNTAAACVGIKFVSTEVTDPWRTFQGSMWEGVVSKPRVVGGNNLDAWIPG